MAAHTTLPPSLFLLFTYIHSFLVLDRFTFCFSHIRPSLPPSLFSLSLSLSSFFSFSTILYQNGLPRNNSAEKAKVQILETPRELWPTTPGKKPEDAVRGFADNLFAAAEDEDEVEDDEDDGDDDGDEYVNTEDNGTF